MKTTELIFILLVFAAAILHLLHIPYSGLLLSILVLALSFFYYVFGFALFNEIEFKDIFRKKTYQNIQSLNIIYAIANGWIISLILIGTLFKVENLPYASYIFTIGISVIGFFIFLSLILFFKTKLKFYTRILSRLFIISIVSSSVYFLM